MTAWPEARGGGFFAAVASGAERWLLEPATPRPRAAEPDPDARTVIAVVGLAPACGTTTIARALAVELAKRDPRGAAIVSADHRGHAAALATGAARRLTRGFQEGEAAAAGRLCLVDRDGAELRDLTAVRPAPIVLDVGHGVPPESAVALAEATILVATPSVEPALADVVAASLTREGAAPRIVLNRAIEPEAWPSRDAVPVGDARLGARLALAGRDPTPALARPIADLADALLGEVGC